VDKQLSIIPALKNRRFDYADPLRLYWPKAEVLDGTWTPPQVKRVSSVELKKASQKAQERIQGVIAGSRPCAASAAGASGREVLPESAQDGGVSD
jgi:hypothetical protein